MKTTIKAHAKINLFLRVMDTRPDGYHNIRGVIQPVNLFDELEMEENEHGVIETLCTPEYQLGDLPWKSGFPIASKDNLATKAAQVIKDIPGTKAGLKITLRKNIPAAAGLGGGSSDAAAILKHLNKKWQTNLSTRELEAKGSTLGCDIPALIHNTTTLAEGRGEIVTPLETGDLSDIWFVLVNPDMFVSTSDIYSQYKYSLTSDESDSKFNGLVSGLKKGSLHEIAQGLHNDLETVVFKKYPLLEIIKQRLLELGAAGALMSGSGATVFGIAENKKHAEQIAGKISEAAGCPLWRSIVSGL